MQAHGSGNSPSPRLPLTVVGGYLGAGKTTLLNALLSDPQGQRIAILVNDFGEVDIDGRLLEASSEDPHSGKPLAGDILTLANGCICCSMVDGFAETLETVRGFADRIDRVVVEVSGVGDPRQVARWGQIPGFTPDGVIVLVDPLSIRDRASDRYVGETVVRQVAGADLVVISRTDLADEDLLVETEAWLATTTDAMVVRSPVPTAVLLGPPLRIDHVATGNDDAHSTPPDHVSIIRHLDAPVSRASVEAWMATRPLGVARAKGLVRIDDRPDDRSVLQVCGSSATVTVDGPWDGGDAVVVAIALPGTPRAGLVKWLGLLR
tara:strand:- start:6165 stop:7127 length:963 start_codon:yes stop_codon:yes gene_type:complete